MQEPIELTEEDLSRQHIELKQLDLDCRVLNQMMGASLQGLSFIECTVGKMTILNWRNSDSEKVKVEVADIVALLMPLKVDKEEEQASSEDEKPLVEKS